MRSPAWLPEICRSTAPSSSAGSSIPKTRYLYYDPFGRVGQIVPPDGSQHAISFSYKGVRETARTVSIGTSWNGSSVTETPSTTTEIYDPRGRLHQVVEPSGAGGSLQTTTYTCDVGNRLSHVAMGAQSRQFNYDGRGFLTAERHPENGVSGDGWVSYLGYDARGNATRKIDGANDLTYHFDRAERLYRVEETGGRPLKEWAFGNSIGFDRSRGKVIQATRHNYVSIPLTNTLSTEVNVRVLETYQYSGVGGRVSQKNTLMDTGPPAAGWAQSWVYDALGNVTSQGYPSCILDPCSLLGEDACSNHCNATAGGAPTQTYSYEQGLLKSVPGKATSITYHPNGLVHQVAHANGVLETQENDPWQMRRPRQISTSGGNRNWSSGIYRYDGAGNIKQMGSDWFTYDPVSRIQHATLEDAPFQGGTVRQQRYTYDRWGNILSIDTKHGGAAWQLRTTPTSAGTNRLNGAGYDASGNMTFWGGYTYVYDAFDMLTEMDGGGNRNRYVYTADDERLWVVDFDPVNGWPESDDYFTLRDLDGAALREYKIHGGNAQPGNWSIVEDRFYRGGSLLASRTGLGQDAHYHLDHLGSPRLVTGDPQVDGAFLLGRHNYFPFGEEATPATQNGLRMKFTGHERDFNEGGGQSTLDDLDYMHARYCNPRLGRFLSVDPAFDVDPQVPQAWNLYAYGRNNPMRFTDPDGAAVKVDYEENARRRAEIKEKISSIPLVGESLAAGADLILADVLPTNDTELQGMADAAVLGMARVPGGGQASGKIGEGARHLVSRIRESASLRRAARRLSGDQQKTIDTITRSLSQGNLDPVFGTRQLFGGVFEARGTDGARVAFRVSDNGTVEILAKFNKRTQKKVIAILRERYAKK